MECPVEDLADSYVYLETEEGRFDFTGVSFDDANDVLLYRIVGDHEA